EEVKSGEEKGKDDVRSFAETVQRSLEREMEGAEKRIEKASEAVREEVDKVKDAVRVEVKRTSIEEKSLEVSVLKEFTGRDCIVLCVKGMSGLGVNVILVNVYQKCEGVNVVDNKERMAMIQKVTEQVRMKGEMLIMGVELLRRAKGADVCTADEYSNLDDHVETCQVASDNDLIDAIKESKSPQTSSNDDDDDDSDEENNTVTYTAAMQS
ncbi:hypothetical protein CAPTEDRAFT_209778, partial [Capitella teleta]